MTAAGSRSVRWLAAALTTGALAAVTYAAVVLTFERAPAIHIRWAASVDDVTRTELQARFALTGGQYDSGRTWVYFLTLPSPSNIEALISSPAVEDTHHIDRLQLRVSPAAERRGPYITGSGPHWLPIALQALAASLALAGALAAGVAVALSSSRRAQQFAGVLRRPATWAMLVLGAGLILVWMPYVAHLRLGAAESLPFRIGDWLVSYEVGFVRRGFSGSPILALTTQLALPPERIVLWIQTALYSLFCVLLFVLAYPKRLNIWFLAFLFSPAGLLFPLYDPAVAGRKDVLFFVAFAFYAWWMPRPERRWARVVTFALGAAMTLTHELFFFFTPYVILMRLLQTKDGITRRHFAPELSLFAGSLVALLLASTIGADMRGEAQCAALLRRGFNEQLCEGIMRYPVSTISDSMGFVAGAVRNFGYLRWYSIASVLAILPLLPILGSMRGGIRRWFLLGAGAAFVFTLPMYAIALDWGRLLNIHVMALAVAVVAFVLDGRDVPGSVMGVRNWWLRAALLVAVFVYLTAWSIRHCCTDALQAGLFA